MELLVLDADLERPDDAGRRRTFLRVAVWWNDDHPAGAEPDAVLDFALATPPSTIRVPVVDRWERRRTRAGRWHPNGRVEVAGDWTLEDPADPWDELAVPAVPLLAHVWPTVLSVARLRRQQGWAGADTFAAAEVTARRDPSQRGAGRGREARDLIGHRQKGAT